MLLVLGALSLGAAAFLVAETATLPARRRRELLRRAAGYGAVAGAGPEADHRPGGAGKALAPVLRAVARLVSRLTPSATREKITGRLLAAGLAQKISPEQLLGAKGLLAACGLFFGLMIGSALAASTGFVLALCFGGLGFLAPDLFVNAKVAQRREQVQAALPDALDLLAVSVEAGLGFDAAVAKLTDYMDGPLIEEFALTLNEIRIGETRNAALRRMASRVDVPELSSFVRAVVQAEELGTSMAGILRVQAADARVRRQFAAEEKAMKAPIKMLLPTAVFIFPAMFIVILGPALLNFAKGF